MKDEESLVNAPQHLGGDNRSEDSALDRIETNFRLVMLSIKELEVATRSTSEDVKAIAGNVVKMEGSLERQTGAVLNLAETMGLALETLREVLDEQDSIKRRLSALEQDVTELKK